MTFFLGCSKSASKAYTHVLRTHTDIHVSSELNLFSFNPSKSVYITYLKNRWMRASLANFAKDLNRLRGTSFWRVGRFSSDDFVKRLKDRWPVSFKSVVKTLLDLDAAIFEKTRIGAKFPAHVVFTPFFLRFTDDSRVILLTREPLPILQSQTNKTGSRNAYRRFAMILHVAVMFDITVFYAWVYRQSHRVLFLPFERFTSNRSETVSRMAHFLDVPYNGAMDDIPVLGSKTGPDQVKVHIYPLERILLRVFTLGFRTLYQRLSAKIASS